MLTDIMFLGHPWYNKQAICSKSNIFRPNQNSKILLDFRHQKDSRKGVLKYFLIHDIAPIPPYNRDLKIYYMCCQMCCQMSNIILKTF